MSRVMAPQPALAALLESATSREATGSRRELKTERLLDQIDEHLAGLDGNG